MMSLQAPALPWSIRACTLSSWLWRPSAVATGIPLPSVSPPHPAAATATATSASANMRLGPLIGR